MFSILKSYCQLFWIIITGLTGDRGLSSSAPLGLADAVLGQLPVHLHESLDLLVELLDLGLVLLVHPQVVLQLLLDLEGLATLVTRMSENRSK